MADGIAPHRSAARTVAFDQGTHWRAKLGFLINTNELVVENNLFRMAPEGVGVYMTRNRTSKVITVAELAKHIETMAEAASLLLPAVVPDVIAYACTSGTIVIGEDRVMAEIRRGAPGSQATTLATGVVNALRALGARRIVVGTPYLDEVNALEATFLAEKGFEVLDIQGLNVEHGDAMGRITPAYIKEFALSIDRREADAIFMSCGGIRTIDVLREIEEACGKPVVASNQAMMWDCLRRVGIDDDLAEFGRLFEIPSAAHPDGGSAASR